MDLGGAAVFVYRPCLYQQRRVQGALPAHLRGGRACALLSVPAVAEKAPAGIFIVGSGVLCAGIFYQLVPGMALGNSLVGLQRTFSESERQNLPGWGGGFRAGRDGAGMPAATAL